MNVDYQGVIALLFEGRKGRYTYFIQRRLFCNDNPPPIRRFKIRGEIIEAEFEENLISEGKTITIYRCKDQAAIKVLNKSSQWEIHTQEGPLTFASVQLQTSSFLH